MEERKSTPRYISSAEFVRRMRMAAEAESAEARAAEWRGRSMEDHERVLLDVLNLSNAIERSKEHPSYRAPLPESRFPWRELRA